MSFDGYLSASHQGFFASLRMTVDRDSLYRHERLMTVTLREAKCLIRLHVYFIMSVTIVLKAEGIARIWSSRQDNEVCKLHLLMPFEPDSQPQFF
jgi:hypothetical protein